MLPTQVEPCLHCVGIVRQVRGRCTDSAAHSLLGIIAARTLNATCAIEPRPMHFSRVHALGVPRIHSTLCVGLSITMEISVTVNE